MLKKFFLTVLLGLSITVGTNVMTVPTASAQDVWVYTWESGSQTYIMTETIGDWQGRGFTVTTKTVQVSGEVHKKNYIFEFYGSDRDCNVYIEGHFASRLAQCDAGTKTIFARAREYVN